MTREEGESWERKRMEEDGRDRIGREKNNREKRITERERESE